MDSYSIEWLRELFFELMKYFDRLDVPWVKSIDWCVVRWLLPHAIMASVSVGQDAEELKRRR